MPIEKNELRRVMGHFATGVTVITTFRNSGEMHGLTANAFTSVSLVPPLLLVCVDKKAESYPCFDETRVFIVNILAHDQEALSPTLNARSCRNSRAAITRAISAKSIRPRRAKASR